MNDVRVAVLGAGIQGACVALSLAQRSIKVDLYEKSDLCVAQASAQNEGKVHLGFVYGNDPSLATARTMARGGMSFAPLMRRWIGNMLDTVPLSSSFYYLVHKRSMLDADDLGQFYNAVHAEILVMTNQPGADYFGIDVSKPPIRLRSNEWDGLFDPANVAAVFATPEIAVAPEALATILRCRLDSDANIRVLARTTVEAVQNGADQISVKFRSANGSGSQTYDHVVNALWEGRLAVDATVGVLPERPWMFRFKQYLRVGAEKCFPVVPSATIALGPFGDIVQYPTGELFLSWYAIGMRGRCAELQPPDAWQAWHFDSMPDFRRRVCEALSGLVPGLARLSPRQIESAEIKGGIIFALGETDIDDVASGLHERHAIGPRSFGRYHSIDTGKYTMAPLFATKLAERIWSSL